MLHSLPPENLMDKGTSLQFLSEALEMDPYEPCQRCSGLPFSAHQQFQMPSLPPDYLFLLRGLQDQAGSVCVCVCVCVCVLVAQ